MSKPQQNLTGLLKAWSEGDANALSRLSDLVYAELKRRAALYMDNERAGHTLETRALINEAFIHLLDLESVRWQNRTHFYALASRMMRRVLVDYARARNYQKRGSGAQPVPLTDLDIAAAIREEQFVALDDALERLAKIDRRKTEIVELKFFGGLSVEEIAEHLNISTITVLRDWKFARAWLERQMKPRE